ncbi:hypothetical protein [Ensifer canadensis]|jgi:hypothetical protein|uniref:hypothetical protein n=1 Tax=Ensifer canadensis TaxID=555315 RepID=UPI000AAB19FA
MSSVQFGGGSGEKERIASPEARSASEDLKGEKIISFSRQNLSYTERSEKFEEYDLSTNVTYSCDDTFSLQRRASYKTRKGRCSTLNCCMLSSLNRIRALAVE